MAEGTSGSGAPRQTWKAEKKHRPVSPLARTSERVFASILGAALLGLLIYILWPTRAPQTHFAYVAIEYDPLAAPPIAFIGRNFELFERQLAGHLCRSDPGCPADLGDNLKDETSIKTIADELEGLGLRSRDVLVLYLDMHGISDDGSAMLLASNFDPTRAGVGRVQLSDVLEALRNLPVKTTLLILDTGHLGEDSRLGMLVNEFPRLLEETVKGMGGGNLWVLNANRFLERSHVSYKERASLLAKYVAEALSGEADGCDRKGNVIEQEKDEEIHLDELYYYVSSRVSAIAGQAGGKGQRPLLLRSGTGVTDPESGLFLAKRRQRGGSGEEPAAEQTAQSSNGGGEPEEPRAAAASGDESAGNEKSQTQEPATAGVPSAMDLVRAQLTEAWRLRDAAMVRRPQRSSPVDYAPHLWRRVEAVLLYYEQQIYRRDVAAFASKADLDGGVALLKALVNQTPPPADLVHDGLLVKAMVRLHDAIPNAPWVDKDKPRSFALERLAALNRQLNVAQTKGTDSFPVAQQYREWSLAEDSVITKPAKDASPAATAEPAKNAPDRAAAPGAESKQNALQAAPPVVEYRFDHWAEKVAADAPDVAELQFAHQVARLVGEVNWATLRLALQTRASAEQAAASSVWCTPWIKGMVERGDSERLRGEKLLGGVGKAVETSREQFDRAGKLYGDAVRATHVLTKAAALRDDVLYRFPYYLQWNARARHRGITLPGIRELVAELFTIIKLFEQADQRDSAITTISDTTDALLNGKSQIDQALQKESIALLCQRGDLDEMEELLSTPLLAADDRLRLLGALAEETKIDPDARPVTEAATHALDWSLLQAQADFELAWIDLCTRFAIQPDPSASLVSQKDNETSSTGGKRFAAGIGDASATDEKRWADCRDLGGWLRDFYRNKPGELKNETGRLSDRTGVKDRAGNIAMLRVCARSLHTVGAREALTIDENGNPLRILHRADWYDLLAWHHWRVVASGEQLSQADYPFLNASLSLLERQANGIQQPPQQPRLGPAPRFEKYFVPELEKQELYLAENEPTAVTLRVTAHQRVPRDGTEGWLALDYDTSVLEVRSGDGRTLYLSSDSGDVTKRESNLRLSPGKTETVPLQVRVIDPNVTREETRLVLQLVCFEGPRRVHESVETYVKLPVIGLLVKDTINGTSKTSESGEIDLRPFPNRPTQYQFGLMNRSSQAKKVRVNVLALPVPPPGASAWDAPFPLDEQGKWIARGDQPEQVELAQSEYDLKPGAEPEWLKLKPPAPKQETPGAAQPAGGVPAAQQIRNGMLCIIQPEDDRAKPIVKHLRILPLHPRDFLQARATYDVEQERIDVEVKPRRQELLPRDGATVVWELRDDDPVEANSRRKLTGKITGDPETLFLQTRFAPGKVVTVRLNVDGYPRAFVFDVRCDEATPVPPKNDLRRLQILAPQRDEAFPAPRETLTVQLEVDAPIGAFDEGGRIEVGIDENRNRDLEQTEQARPIFFDRQVDVLLVEIAGDGFFNVQASVSDFSIDVPTPGIENERVSLLGRLMLADQSVAGDDLEIVFDGADPEIHSVVPKRTGKVVAGEKILVEAVASDGDQARASGIDTVQFEFSEIGKGDGTFDEKTHVPGQFDGNDQWSRELSTEGLEPGSRHAILVRAKDNVGRLSEVWRTAPFEVVRPAPPAKASEPAVAEPVIYSIQGTVKYGKMVAGAKVELYEAPEQGNPKLKLSTTTDKDGKFEFKAIKEGEYIVLAEKYLKNAPRKVVRRILLKAAAGVQNPFPLNLTLE